MSKTRMLISYHGDNIQVGSKSSEIHFSEFRILTSDKINSRNELENFWSKIRQTRDMGI